MAKISESDFQYTHSVMSTIDLNMTGINQAIRNDDIAGVLAGMLAIARVTSAFSMDAFGTILERNRNNFDPSPGYEEDECLT